MLGMGWFPESKGGADRHFRDLFERLREVAPATEAVVLGGEIAPEQGVVVAAAPDDRLISRLRSFKTAAERVGRSADFVDAHFALYAFLPVVVGRLRGKPLVVHFHGPWADESAAARTSARATILAKRLLERSVYRRAGTTVTLSGAFKRILVERYGISPWLVNVIPPGVDLDRFRPGDRHAARALLSVDADVQMILAVRRLTPRTGVDVLLRAFARLDGDHLLVIAGEGPERGRLERLATDLGIAGSVRLLGDVSDEQLVALYQAADVSVVPSLSLEGFGLSVLESLACGTPVVASDVGGLPEALAGLEPRSIVPAGDASALADRLRQPLPSRSACRGHAERFSWKPSIDRHIALNRRVVHADDRRALRVVYLDHTARLSGAELALLRLLPALEGVEAHVILGEEGPLVSRLLEAGLSVEVLPLGRRVAELSRHEVGPSALGSREPLQATAYALRLAGRLRRLRPDLVHTNSLKAAFYGGLAARLAGVPVVSHIHDRIAEDYLPSGAVRLTHLALQRLPNAIVVASRTVADTLGRPASIIPCPVTTREERPPREGGPFTVGMVGRIAPWKGQHVFLEAFARAFPEGDARAVIVGAPVFGTDEERYLADLRAQAQEHGLNGRVRFAGFVEDVDAELTELDVLVHASVIPEPFGQVVLEGMAAGLPVVAADAGGPAEIVADGVTGLLYGVADTTALTEALEKLAQDADLRRRLGAAARKRAQEYAPGPIAARMRQVYEDVLGACLPTHGSTLDARQVA